MYYDQKKEEVLENLKTTEKGLSKSEASRRLQEYGRNIIEKKQEISPFKIFLGQFASPLVWILMVAIVISLIVGHMEDAIVIGIILIVNAILGFIQEFRAEKAIEALMKMASLKAVVLRDGKETSVDAGDIVPGDIVILEEGEKIPADARVLDSIELNTQEAALTGESLPVKKVTEKFASMTGVADRKNMVYSGTVVTSGRGIAVVTGTGMNTELGKIAHMIQTAETKMTPLQKKLKRLAKVLGALTLLVCFIVFITGVVKGGSILEFLIAAVSLAVAAIPEGLTIVVTISMAIGVQKMAKKNALIRKLPSVETLGCTTVICSDKTGTLTHNQMTVKMAYVDDEIIEVTGSGYKPEGRFSSKPKSLNLLLRIGALCNNAKLDNNTYEIIGDPTEGALIVSARKGGLDEELMSIKHRRLEEIPFSSERKIMTTIHKDKTKKVAYIKGAPDVVLGRCTHIHIGDKVKKLTKEDRDKILKKNEYFADSALRVLGFAYRDVNGANKKDVEKNLVFVGLQAMIDPPRKEVRAAIDKCRKAGIRVVMITGDHKTTAMAIARELGIKGRAVTGNDLEQVDLKKEVEEIGIYARVNPAHKLKIVEALKHKGHIVAMTGDGVNDAPALKKADIGIAMGITGTDVSKEAADMILTDDNFKSIVNAVEEGRGIYDNIKKFVEYLLSSNIGEILTIFGAIIIGLPLPLIAIMILWVNLVTDGLPALALGVDPADKDIMERPPRKPKDNIVGRYLAFYMFMMGMVMMGGTLLMFYLYDPIGNYAYATSIAFTTLMMFQMFNVLNCRSANNSLFSVGFFTNKKLLWAILGSVALQFVVIYTPLSTFFKTVPISGMDWVYITLVSSSIWIVGEVSKWLRRMAYRNNKVKLLEA